MGLDQLLKSIDQKVKNEVGRIRKEAEQERERIIGKAKREAQERKEQIIEEAKRQVDEQMRRELVKVRREEKRSILNLKSEMVDQTFQEAKDKFLKLDEKEYLPLIKDALAANIERGDEEILMSPRDRGLVNRDFIKEIEKTLAAKGSSPGLKFSFGLNEEDRGFIVKSEDVQINATISALFSAVKDKEEIEVARLLFG